MPNRNGKTPVIGQSESVTETGCEHEATLWKVLDHSIDGILIVAVDSVTPQFSSPNHFHLVAANQAARKMLGHPLPEVPGSKRHTCLADQIVCSISDLIQQCLEKQDTIECETCLNGDGKVAHPIEANCRQLKIQLSPVWDQNDTIIKIVALCQDLTERRRVDQELRLVQNITLEIAQAEDFETALSIALRSCCEATGWNYGEAWIPNPKTQILECSPAWYISLHAEQNLQRLRSQPPNYRNDLKSIDYLSALAYPQFSISHFPLKKLQKFRQVSEQLTFKFGTGLPGRIWKTKESEWHWDVSCQNTNNFLRAKLAIDCGLKAGLGVPIVAQDQVLAVLVFFMFESRAEDQRLVELVSAIAAQLGSLIQRKQAEDALRESERKLSHLINSLPGFVFSCANDLEWSMTYLSDGCQQLTGYQREELSGNSRLISYNSITHPEDLPKVLHTIEKALANKHPYVVEYRIQTKSGQEKWLWEKGSGVFDAQGQLREIEGFISDITEQKQAEAQLEYRLEFEKLIATISTQFINLSLDGIDNGINQALARIGIFSDVDRSYICLLSENGTQMDHSYEWCRPGIQPLVEQLKGIAVDTFPWLAQKRQQLETINIPDVEALPAVAIAEKQALASQGVQSMLSVPMVYRETLVGFVGFDSVRSRKTWPDDIIALIKIVGEIFVNALERKRAEEELRAAEAKYHSIFENAVEGIFQTTPEGIYLTANPMLARIYGYESPAELILSISDIENQLYVDPLRRSEFMRLLQKQDAVWEFESEVYRKDGSIIWISENARAIRDQQGELIGYEGTVVDITQRKQAEAELHKRDQLLQGVAQAMTYLLTDTNHRAAVIKALATLGTAASIDRVYICENHPHPATGEIATSMRFEWTRDSVERILNRPYRQNLAYSALGTNQWFSRLSLGQTINCISRDLSTGELPIMEWDGTLSTLMVPILVNSQFWGYIGFDDCHGERQWSKAEESILVAIAASIGGALLRHRKEALIRHQAFHDRLTGLPNRQMLDERLPLALTNALKRRHKLAVMFLDLDRFKIINDSLGHAIGDQLLRQAADRLSNCLREQDTIVRWGGDEFIILVPQINSAEDASNIAQRIQEVLRPAFEIDGHQLYITSSIGIALYPDDGNDTESLIKNADTALYRVKEQGRNHHQFYTAAMNSYASELLAWENDLHHALEKQEFLLYYQPQMNLETGQIVGMEALIRWQHPVLGLVSPQTFIPLAEDNGLILPLGQWVLETACAQNKAWQDAGLQPVRMAVNLSNQQFQQENLVEIVKQVLQKTSLDPHFLELEIMETTAIKDAEFTSSMLRELRNFGVHLSMDDFGMGYGSLNSLKHFPFHTIKIDQSFVRDMTIHGSDEAIVQAIITLGRSLNLRVVAEGVETQNQLDLLKTLGCQEIQGFFYSPPLAAEQATQLLAQQSYTSSV